MCSPLFLMLCSLLDSTHFCGIRILHSVLALPTLPRSSSFMAHTLSFPPSLLLFFFLRSFVKLMPWQQRRPSTSRRWRSLNWSWTSSMLVSYTSACWLWRRRAVSSMASTRTTCSSWGRPRAATGRESRPSALSALWNSTDLGTITAQGNGKAPWHRPLSPKSQITVSVMVV